jgi:phage tail sheath gpL-like
MPAPEIPITGIDATYRVPGTYAEIFFAQGPAAASAGPRSVCFVMPKTSTGLWTAATMYEVGDEKTAADGAGLGSPLHRALRMFFRAGGQKCYALPVAETSGGSPIAATAVLTIATNASGTGTLTVTVCGEDCSYTFAYGATPTVIGDGIVDAVNSKTHLPCTAGNASGTVTFTAKLKGTSQGTASLGVIRVRSTITAGVATTASFGGAHLGTGAAGVEGSTTEAANTLTALNTIVASRKYYLVSSALDATTLGHFKTHIATKAEPRQGKRTVAIAAYTGSLANCQTLATGRNYERLAIAWQYNSEHDAAEIAGNVAAVRSKREQTDSAYNFAGYGEADWLILPAFAESDWPDGDDQNDAINDGITCIASNEGRSYIVMSVDTRSKNPAGTVDDFRACETHRISVCDEFVDERINATELNFRGKKLMDDERLQNGAINTNQRIIPGVIRPSYLRKPIYQQLDEYEAAGKLQNIAASKEALRIVKSKANASRVECALNLHVIDHAHQFTYRVSEVSSG